MRLLCDAMLGSLARWLRLLGHDTAYLQADDAEVLAAASREERVLLTRDAALAASAQGPSFLVQALDPEAQLREVADALGLGFDPSLALSRCSVCNAPLRAATPAEVDAKAPPSVRATAPAFRACDGCGRLYWRGTHTARIEAALRALPERGA